MCFPGSCQSILITSFCAGVVFMPVLQERRLRLKKTSKHAKVTMLGSQDRLTQYSCSESLWDTTYQPYNVTAWVPVEANTDMVFVGWHVY